MKGKKLIITLSNVAKVDSYIEIYDALQNKIITYDSHSAGSGEKVSNFYITKDDIYYIVIGQRNSNPVDNYLLSANVEVITKNEEKESECKYVVISYL